jgi:hypothetical protein
MLEGLLTCAALGFHWVYGGHDRNKRRRAYFNDLGFREVGGVVQLHLESGRSHPPAQLIELEVSPRLCANWTQRKAAVIDRLREQGFGIEDNGLSVS